MMTSPNLLETAEAVVEDGGEPCEEEMDWEIPVSFTAARHNEEIIGSEAISQTWRMKERMKTVSVALVFCLNIGVDPPDIVKPHDCARLECWIDPVGRTQAQISNILERIGTNLEKQYECWQPRARYKKCLDPSPDDVKKLCTSLRRHAKDERVLFHYNGHGVPKPTTNGEIWVFNKDFTKYIPLSLYDLQTYMGAPSTYVYDCSNAGIIVDLFKQFAEQQEKDYQALVEESHGKADLPPPPSYRNCIQLAACSADEVLPMNPELPADVFTSCLTTPIKMAVRWFVMQRESQLVPGIKIDIIDKIPGQMNDRRTMLGELNWIFTAITDTIAWNTLPRDIFQRLFRQDLLVASLFRNFLLAERILKSYNCTPVSSPKLPPTDQHPMWQAWDLALDACLFQLPGMLERNEPFRSSQFFKDQLTAFDVWLKFGSNSRKPPEQLPVVLQVLLSQVHRMRALNLLGKFLDLGPWAVNHALSVGIFPYILKLLQSSAPDLCKPLVFIWSKILAVDKSCQVDLVRDRGHKYFLSVMSDYGMPAEYRTMAAFVLTNIVSDYLPGQEIAVKDNIISLCLMQLEESYAPLRHWSVICLGKVWENYENARWCGARDIAHEKLYTILSDNLPEVRAAAVFALGTFINSAIERSEQANNIDHAIARTLMSKLETEASPLVRQEILVALQWMFLIFEKTFVSVVMDMKEDEQRSVDSVLSPTLTPGPDTSYSSPSPGIRRISSRDRLKYLTSSSPRGTYAGSPELTWGDGGFHGVMSPTTPQDIRRVGSSSSLISMTGSGSHNFVPSFSSMSSYTSLCRRLWIGMLHLERDPHLKVSSMSKVITDSIRTKVKRESRLQDVPEVPGRRPTHSAPGSPANKSGYLSGDSPPHINNLQSDGLPPIQQPKVTTLPRNRKLSVPARQRPVITEIMETDSRKSLVSTHYLAWCCKGFTTKKQKQKEEEDPQSHTYHQREWWYLRNQKVRCRGRRECEKPGVGSLVEQMFIYRNQSIPTDLLLHPYEPHIVIAEKDSISLWSYDREHNGHLTYHTNHTSKNTRITDTCFVNVHERALLLVATDDGAVRLWRNYAPEVPGDKPTLVAAWQALPEMHPSARVSAGHVMAWEQKYQQLASTGDIRFIRLWDVQQEQCVHDINTGAESAVTTITSDDAGGHLLVCGCGDGTVRMFDRRLPPSESRVMTWREHDDWVVGVRFHRLGISGPSKVVSGCCKGDVRCYDLRYSQSLARWETGPHMTAMAIHPLGELFACGYASQNISIYNLRGECLSNVKYHDGFMGQRIGPVSCLTFHDYLPQLSAGSTDSFVSIYTLGHKR